VASVPVDPGVQRDWPSRHLYTTSQTLRNHGHSLHVNRHAVLADMAADLLLHLTQRSSFAEALHKKSAAVVRRYGYSRAD